jgi:2'-5' RNA ligase
MARLFFAVELPPEARAEALRVASELSDRLPETARSTPEENLHLSLKFIADLDADRIPKLLASAAPKLAPVAPFEVRLQGSGAFPSLRAARVVWIGVGEGGPLLARLARKLDASAARQGAPRERRPYRAHLTLARLREPTELAVDSLPVPESLAFTVDEVVLYESRLSSAGVTHVPLTRLPLGATEADPFEFAPEP